MCPLWVTCLYVLQEPKFSCLCPHESKSFTRRSRLNSVTPGDFTQSNIDSKDKHCRVRLYQNKKHSQNLIPYWLEDRIHHIPRIIVKQQMILLRLDHRVTICVYVCIPALLSRLLSPSSSCGSMGDSLPGSQSTSPASLSPCPLSLVLCQSEQSWPPYLHRTHNFQLTSEMTRFSKRGILSQVFQSNWIGTSS